MLDSIKKHKKYIIIGTLAVILLCFAVMQYSRAEALRYRQEIEYNRVFSELTQYVDDLEISLLKGQVVSTPSQMAKLSTQLYTQASGAKANLSLLPLNNVQMEKTSEFLSQVGEYASCVYAKMLKGEKLSREETETMRSLCEYADKLSRGFDEMLAGINEGTVSFSDEEGVIASLMSGGKTAMSDELKLLEEEFHNYPSLVYDGPFSQHLELKQSPLLKEKQDITEQEAQKIAAAFMNGKESHITQVEGKLPSYIVKGNNTCVELTKQGGILLVMMRDRYIDEEKLSEKEAMKKAELFLKDNGFSDMKESYYEKRDGSIVINYAYYQDGYMFFPDLVKVKVALDNGEIIGFESRGYIMNHITREIPKPKVTQQQALKNVSESMKTLDVSEAVIPLENGAEACCFQIKGVVMDKHFLMYVNTQTGETEDVQILLESENGTLAV